MASATQWYLTRSRSFYTRYTTLTIRGGWDKTSAANPTIYVLDRIKSGLNGTGVSYLDSGSGATNPYSVLGQRFVSEPLAAQTISGTVNITMGAQENSVNANDYWKVYIYATVGDTDAVRGIILNLAEDTTNEWPTTATAIAFQAAAALTSTALTAGDRIVVEIGYVARNVDVTSYTGALWSGCTTAGAVATQSADLALGVTSSATLQDRAPFLTFSNAITVLEVEAASGDIIAGNGDVFLFDGTLGTLRKVVYVPGNLGCSAGAQDTAGNIYVTNENTSYIYKYDNTLELLASYADALPARVTHSMAFDQSGNFYVGHAGTGGGDACGVVGTGTPTAGTYPIRKFTSAGVLSTDYTAASDQGGVPAIDLANDQATMYYTSIGRKIKRFDVSANVQLTDLVTLATDGGMARGIKLLPENGGMLVADAINIKRLSAAGLVTQTYTTGSNPDWGTVTLNADATVFWSANTGDVGTPQIAKFNLATGSSLLVISGDTVPDVGVSQLCSGGILCYNGYRAGTASTVYSIRRLRRAPHLNNERLRIFYQRFELDLESGLGLTDDPDTSPEILLRWSDDGGHTWSSYYTLTAGVRGDYTKRLFRNRLGSARDRIFEVSTTDDAAWRLLAAYLDAQPGTK